jgi:hypothetical protein
MVKFLVVIFLFNAQVFSMVPIEDLVMTGASEEQRYDPLDSIFQNRNQKSLSDKVEIGPLKLYYHQLLEGEKLQNSCEFVKPAHYFNDWEEKQAKRSIVSTLQWIGLQFSVKAIGKFASDLNLNESDYNQLIKNMMNNYCSQNLTSISLKKVEKLLLENYATPEKYLFHHLEQIPYATEKFRNIISQENFKSTQLDYAVKSFRSFCSWGGDTEDYRLLSPYLKNPIIMNFVFQHLQGLESQFDQNKGVIQNIHSSKSHQVLCDELICRKVTKSLFDQKFKLSVGSSGLETDLQKLYCHHFQFQDYSAKTLPWAQNIVKKFEVEESLFEALFFISLMTRWPDPLFGLEKYVDIPFLIKSSMDEQWQFWAKKALSLSHRELFYEESPKLRVERMVKDLSIGVSKFELRASFTLGEFDRVIDGRDKFRAQMNLKVPLNYFIQLVKRWQILREKIDLNGQKLLMKDFASYLMIQLKEKEKYFQSKIWTDEFSKILADELLLQALNMKGSLLKNYSNTILTIPLEIEYGLFALSYLKDRGEVQKP